MATISWFSARNSSTPGVTGLPVAGQLIGGKYRIEALIGRGGMGAVYRATHVLMGKLVALKWLFPDFSASGDGRQRFLGEARAAASIRHPNVVDVYDVGEENGALYMVMELLEGHSLESSIQRGEMPIRRLLSLLIQAMQGVAAAHARGIVHRDIKPENIFVVDEPTQGSAWCAKVLDFGVSKLAGAARRNQGLTRTGALMGTPMYMSPEQMNAPRDVDARADVYSFGVILYRASTGVLPFQGETLVQLGLAVTSSTPVAPRALRPELPEALESLIMTAMARRREDRFPTLEALIEAASAVSAGMADSEPYIRASVLPPCATPISHERLRVDDGSLAHDSAMPLAPPQPPPRVGRSVLLVAGLVASVAVLASLLSLLVQSPPQLPALGSPPLVVPTPSVVPSTAPTPRPTIADEVPQAAPDTKEEPSGSSAATADARGVPTASAETPAAAEAPPPDPSSGARSRTGGTPHQGAGKAGGSSRPAPAKRREKAAPRAAAAAPVADRAAPGSASTSAWTSAPPSGGLDPTSF